MSKKILVITGSPRKHGNSNTAASAFIDAVKAKGHEVIRFDAAKKQLTGCNACEKCFENGKACVYDDEFNEIAPDIETADAIVFTMPLYWFSFPAQLKAVIDRFYAFAYAEKDISGKECGLIVCCEDDDIAAMAGTVKSYESIIDYLKWISVGVVLVTDVNKVGDIDKTNGISRVIELAKKF